MALLALLAPLEQWHLVLLSWHLRRLLAISPIFLSCNSWGGSSSFICSVKGNRDRNIFFSTCLQYPILLFWHILLSLLALRCLLIVLIKCHSLLDGQVWIGYQDACSKSCSWWALWSGHGKIMIFLLLLFWMLCSICVLMRKNFYRVKTLTKIWPYIRLTKFCEQGGQRG